jgi:hypothetical protein
MTTDSYAAFDATRVFAACYDWMAEQSALLEGRRKARVDELMSRRFFRPRSVAEAEKKLGFTLDPWDALDLSGWVVWNRVKSLSLLAGHASVVGADVYVTAEMSTVLSVHLSRNLS